MTRNRKDKASGAHRVTAAGAGGEPRIKVEVLNASQSYFSQVPNFKPNAAANFDDEFHRLASSQGVTSGSHEWRRKRTDAIRHEMVFHFSQRVVESDEDDDDDDGDGDDYIKREFGDDYGRLSAAEWHETHLRIFQNMCVEAKLEPAATIDGCVASLRGVLVNIVDYIDARRSGRPIKVWPPHQFEAFREYTLGPGRRIDQKTAKGTVLEPLLQLLRPVKAAQVYADRQHYSALAQEDCVSRITDRGIVIAEKTLPHPPREQCLPVIKAEEPNTFRPSLKPVCDVISIHGTDSELSSSPSTPVKEEPVACPWSPNSVGSSIIEILANTQTEFETTCPSSAPPIKGEDNDREDIKPCPWSPHSVGSSVIEILNSTQTDLKRDLDDFAEGEDKENYNTLYDLAPISTYKRLRTAVENSSRLRRV